MSNWYKLIDGKVVKRDPSEPGDWMQSDEIRRVGYTEFPNGAYVSTVFLGLDHGWGGGPPVLWETMAFWHDHELDNECERYTSREDAEAGHEAMVARVRDAIAHPTGAAEQGRREGG